jgi:hypothetical protein
MQHRFASRDEMKHFYGWIMVGVGIVVTCIGQGAVLSLGFRGGRLRVHPGHGTRAVGHCMHVQPTPPATGRAAEPGPAGAMRHFLLAGHEMPAPLHSERVVCVKMRQSCSQPGREYLGQVLCSLVWSSGPCHCFPGMFCASTP